MNARGFTLIEMLIALAIFSLISIGALASLNQMIRAREHQISHHDNKQHLMFAYANIYQDMQRATQKPLSKRGEPFQFDGEMFKFSKTPAFQEIYYHIENGSLYRTYLHDDAMMPQLLLDNVKNLRLSWSEDQSLFMIRFTDDTLGDMTWSFTPVHL